MGAFVVIVTATSATIEDLHELAQHLSEDDSIDEWDDCSLLLSPDDAVDLNSKTPADAIQSNTFAGATLESIEAMLSANVDRMDSELNLNARQVVILDDESLHSDGVLLLAANAAKDSYMEDWWDDEPPDHELWQMAWWKARVPRRIANSILANLSIANMDFQEYCGEPIEPKGWFEYTAVELCPWDSE